MLDRRQRLVSFQVGRYDHKRRLIIDPVLAYSTYLDGQPGNTSKNVNVTAIAVDSAGSAYVTGYLGQAETFVNKLSSDGTLIYSAYLSGFDANNAAYAIAVNSAGEAYIAGTTSGGDFPTAHPLQAALAGTADAFVTKLNAAGNALVYSTYLGGSGAGVGHLRGQQRQRLHCR